MPNPKTFDIPPPDTKRSLEKQGIPEARSPREIEALFHHRSPEGLNRMGREVCETVHGDSVYLRGLIEFTNYCTSNCLYCGIRRENQKVHRYRMDEAQILDTVAQGVKLGFKTFVLQGGEDPKWTVDRICRLVESIKSATQGRAAVTLSCGMKSRRAYQRFSDAGADRYLLRFETSDPELHQRLRDGQTLDHRLAALEGIKAAGFQVGSGFMTGLPGETPQTRLDNILLCQSLGLDMVGIGPFIPHPDTPLAREASRGLALALQGTALLRLALPLAHIPATTAAGSIAENGREQMLLCGANVLMPNITPSLFKKSYLLYPGKICIEENCAQSLAHLEATLPKIGRRLSYERADAIKPPPWGHSRHLPKGGRYG
ncbi:MAG: [FeFe] hydrogenase H-cluster radical SAM maturase HydE [Desulfobacter sp.]|nr:MAG: [FeFe] hydrogenase H-cluster radical SAM maturase HydE [Desulfobacter sp.]